MTLIRKYVINVFVIVVLLMSGIMFNEQNSAYACSCAMAPGSYEDELADSDFVFDGVVTNKKAEGSLLGTISSDDPVKWTFQVSGSWKGEVTEVVTVHSVLSTISCGYEFEVGKRYAVFATEINDKISVSNCSKTMIIADNSEIFTELGTYKDDYNVPPIEELSGDIGINPNSTDDKNSKFINEPRENSITFTTINDQKGFPHSEVTNTKESVEKVNPKSIITIGIMVILLIVFGMLIYRKIRK